MTDIKLTKNTKREQLETIYNSSFDKLDNIIIRQETLIKEIISKYNINPDDLYV